MIRTLAAVAALLALGAGGQLHAQVYQPPRVSPYGTGGFSPYLNLLRPGNPAVNYYGLVVPQIQASNQIAQLQQQVARQGQQSLVAPPTNQAPVETGHTTRFMQYNQYFNTTSQQRPAGAPVPPATFGRR
jgi:hypothetical protein